MNIGDHKFSPARRSLLSAVFVLALLVAVTGCGSSVQATGSFREFKQHGVRYVSHTSCPPGRHVFGIPKGFVPAGEPILVGPIAVGCGRRLGEPIRFIAYVQALRHGGEQMCYVLEQPRQKATTGGGCVRTAPSSSQCREGCPLFVERAPSGDSQGKKTPTASLVTGSVPGAIESLVLGASPLGKAEATRPFIVVLKGTMRERLRLAGVISLFASFVVPCLSARQVVQARGESSGGEFTMQGSDPFGCSD